ncbi:hypothetical protein EDB81DRAFT_37339 [Dactylonectria macrodidyma]|uniref:non-specific serine/threonine protein kinase n=1 Tax=Dactylonectria macrodidyma TaxID=307937 RepID=A0A9P9FUC9_9HYPO|nr:hypothetical protein EDB81DRAFT_37339 [Dactylonectria macrodidyma]
MDDFESLRKQLQEAQARALKEQHQREEEQRLRKAAEDHALKEQRQREEEQRLRKAAEDHALEEQRQRKEEQRQRKEEQRQHKEEQRQRKEEQRQRKEEQRLRKAAEDRALKEQHQREEEQRLRKAAEDRASAMDPLPLRQYLEICHSLRIALTVVTDPASVTQGAATNPTGRFYPRRIIPWTAFAREQEKVWDQLASSPSFSSRAAFPSQHQMDGMRSRLRPVSSEAGLRYIERDVVELAIENLVDATCNDAILKGHLGLTGTVRFESHTNLGATSDSLSTSMEQGSGPTSKQTNRRQAQKVQGKGNRADQFCIYQASNNRYKPVVAIEYKPPHKLTREEITTGLVSEIQPDRDVINQEGDGFEFAARRLTTAVITQLFSYMIGKKIQYGYVCTGEAYIFLHISDDPSCVYYSICIPSLDVQDEDETRLHRTAVAQIFAFVLHAIQSPPLSQAWHEATAKLEKWAVEFDHVLRDIPETDRKPRRVTPFKVPRWKGFVPSPIRTRAQCLPPQDKTPYPRGGGKDDDANGSCQPASNPAASRGRSLTTSANIGSSKKQEHSGNSGSQEGINNRPKILDRPYCTHECLRGLAVGGEMDESCPNFTKHGDEHITIDAFLIWSQHQLATDRGCDADCAPLYLSGARGSLFKFCLSSHGYTLVAKGVEYMDAEPLRYEKKVYDHVRDLQGRVVPVCLGIVDLIKPYYYDCGVYKHFLFLSYGGESVSRGLGEVNAGAVDEILMALGRLHQYGVLHRDVAPRNVLYDKLTGRCMIVDLMVSEIRTRKPLGSVYPSGQNQKKKTALRLRKEDKDVFAAEMQMLRWNLY